MNNKKNHNFDYWLKKIRKKKLEISSGLGLDLESDPDPLPLNYYFAHLSLVYESFLLLSLEQGGVKCSIELEILHVANLKRLSNTKK